MSRKAKEFSCSVFKISMCILGLDGRIQLRKFFFAG